jgi:peptidoglycan-associated lipoprotein
MSSTSLKIAALFAATAALSACAHKPPPPAPVASSPTETMPPPPRDMPPPPREVGTRATGPIPGSVQDFAVNAGDRVFFDYDQYAIRADGQPILDKQAQWLQRYPQVQVRIEGNADERGTEEYNFALAGRRADAVKSYLMAHGVGAGRITTISYGKERPLDPGGSDESMAKNRNGHTAIVSGSAG